MSLGVYDAYADAQRAVDHLSDHEFPVENCMIVGTDLKQVERVTGRLTTGRVAVGGMLSGLWLGLFIGLVFAVFGTGETPGGPLHRAVRGAVRADLGAGRVRRHPAPPDFTSVSQVVATKYEVLVEHKLAQRGREPRADAGRSVAVHRLSSDREGQASGGEGRTTKAGSVGTGFPSVELGTRTPDPLHAMEVRYQLPQPRRPTRSGNSGILANSPLGCESRGTSRVRRPCGVRRSRVRRRAGAPARRPSRAPGCGTRPGRASRPRRRRRTRTPRSGPAPRARAACTSTSTPWSSPSRCATRFCSSDNAVASYSSRRRRCPAVRRSAARCS